MHASDQHRKQKLESVVGVHRNDMAATCRVHVREVEGESRDAIWEASVMDENQGVNVADSVITEKEKAGIPQGTPKGEAT